LLQRAKNIYLLYNTESDALGSGEKSRFLTQLLYELPKINPNVLIEEKLVNIPVDVTNSGNEITIQKTETILNKLKSIAERGFSPSLLNKYRNCSLQFYFHAIAGLKETDEVEETIGADVLGNAIHEVLEQLYLPFVGKKINASDVKNFKQHTETLILTAFEKEYSKAEISYGKNLLTVKVALKFLNNFLDTEIKLLNTSEKEGKPIIIKSLEQSLESTLTIGGQQVRLHGKADRIDGLGATTRIIDYKTGIAENKELKFEEWETIITDSKLAKSFQLLMYAWMYQQMNPQIKDNMLSGIITFRELSSGLKTVKINNNELLDVDILKKFEEQLQQLLIGIFDTEVPFKQTDTIENCEYCAFKGICNR
jgi:ATP-dependent helicase/nuclease subunit B